MSPTTSPTVRPARTHRTSTSIEALESRIAPAAFVVTTLTDIVAADGFVSLREAILAANNKLAYNEASAGDADGNSITFDPSLSGSLELSGPLTISDDLTIDGTLPGGDALSIDGLSSTTLFIIDTTSGAGANHDVSLSHLTLVDGVSTVAGVDGGAIAVGGSKLTLNDVEIDGGSVLNKGGAIYAQDATLLITNSFFGNNIAGGGTGAIRGGAIYADHSNVTIKDSSFHANTAVDGGSIAAENGSSLTLTRVDFESDFATGSGGSIYLNASSLVFTTGSVFHSHASGAGGGIASVNSNVTLNFVDFDGNSASGSGGAISHSAVSAMLAIHGGYYGNNTSQANGGAIASSGNLSIDGVEFDSNGIDGTAAAASGGAIYLSGGAATISNSSLHDNYTSNADLTEPTHGGGGIYSSAALTLIQSTLVDNTTNDAGGNLHIAGGTATIDNSTIVGGNSGDGSPNVVVRNTIAQFISSIIAGSSDDIVVRGTGIVGLDHSLAQTLTTPISSIASIIGEDPLLGSFGDHGGPLPTFDLLPGSPAIDAGSDPHSLPTDQRGAPFARTEGAGIDIGAFESLPFQEVTLLAHGKKAQFRDVDGDLVTISTSRGAFTTNDFYLIPEGLGARLVFLDISFRPEFAGANIGIKAARSVRGGDGLVNVSNFEATGVDLGNVLIDGDVSSFHAGDSDAATAGVNGLNVVSIGEFEGFGDIQVTGAMNSLKVRTDVTDTEITISGGPTANLSKVKITGSVLATDIEVDGGISAFTVFGNVIGTSLIAEGSIGAISNATTPGKFRYSGGVVVKGSVLGGDIGTNGDLANFRVSGDVQGTLVSARGDLVTPDLLTAQTMGALTIGGRASHSDFLLGYDLDLNSVNPDVQLDKVTVTGGWVGSNLAVGAEQGADGFLGTADDTLIEGGNATITSGIAALVIKGAAYGTPGQSGDFYGIAAEEIVKGKIALATLPLSAGAGNDLGPTLLGVSFDFAVHEVSGVS